MIPVLRALIRELRSPVGDSTAELLSDVDEVLAVIDGICDEVDVKTRVDLMQIKNAIGAASNKDGRSIASSLATLLDYITGNDNIDAPGLELRLQTLLRRSLPASGAYDTPQSNLKAPFDPTKSGRYITTM